MEKPVSEMSSYDFASLIRILKERNVVIRVATLDQIGQIENGMIDKKIEAYGTLGSSAVDLDSRRIIHTGRVTVVHTGPVKKIFAGRIASQTTAQFVIVEQMGKTSALLLPQDKQG